MADAIASSPLRDLAIYLLRNVPGLPPIIQSVHILGIAAIMASTIMIDLRILGVAVPSQRVDEMVKRLMPWTWWALLSNFLTGLPFVLARPGKYFFNPVFAWKITFLVPAVLLALTVHRLTSREDSYWEQSSLRRIAAKAIAGLSLVLWLGVVMAGRWVAYSDYLFWSE